MIRYTPPFALCLSSELGCRVQREMPNEGGWPRSAQRAWKSAPVRGDRRRLVRTRGRACNSVRRSGCSRLDELARIAEQGYSPQAIVTGLSTIPLSSWRLHA